MPEFRFTPQTLKTIREHAANRMNGERIALYLGCDVGTVERICRQHGISLVSISDGAPPVTVAGRENSVPVQCAIEAGAMDKLRVEAARRGVRVQVLVARMAEVVAKDNLFAAVFDK